MSLFTPNTTPIFLKEDSDTSQQIARLKELHAQATGKLKDDIARELSLVSYGEVGEKNIAFELKNSGMPMCIIHDLHLQHEDLTAQIDYVVVTRKLVFFIECKNLYGNIEIDNQGNFVRSYPWNGRTVREGIYSPITQNQRHLEVYRQLRLAKATNPIKRLGFQSGFDNFHQSIVVLANPKTVLNAKYAKKDVKDRVIRADQLINHIKNQNKKSKELASSEKAMQAWAEKILALHQPLASDYTQKYEAILTGVTVAAPAPPKTCSAPLPESEKAAVRETDDVTYTVSSPQNDDLIARLKAYRLATSRKENVQAYVVFNNQQLENLITQKPKTLADLQRLPGFGPVKTEKYGPAILAVINPAKQYDEKPPKADQNPRWSPSQLVGEKVNHQSFGTGTVKSVSRHEIIIKFPATARSFAFPDVFETTIWLTNPALQQKVEALIGVSKG
ncbi:HRDC domain-containing protein [Acetobacterium wieringae]|uniref:ATP-dependent DNA helicase UvrD2 n=1 Tax=Acetobacterium wieringae TaxID=52694 RepID=A0A1F2PFX7_9FIRM|nr:HRDC domain-containing protein [Acetobacterium wieringae]OFV69601.1 ATP-dependent DNA helicase UvrD2 [Acetobacterium wieringae]